MTRQVVGVTGPNGFVAGHLIRRLQHSDGFEVIPCPRTAFEDEGQLADFVERCDTVVHLAGINRGTDEEIRDTNAGLVDQLVAAAERRKKPLRMVFASSTQSSRDNVYGRSKKYGEERFAAWGNQAKGRRASILEIPNVYGPGCRPFYNSVVATFCYQLANGEQPTVVDDAEIEFVWINQLVDEICSAVERTSQGVEFVRIRGNAKLKVSDLLAKLVGYRDAKTESNLVPDTSGQLDASLYATYLSYLNLDQHCHSPVVHQDERGRLFEIIRLANGGQVFFSTTKPGVIRGNHFHTRKVEWFCVLKGKAAIRLRHVDDSDVREFQVSGDSPQFISIPVLYTHQIENVGTEDLLTMFWCNEVYCADDPDTYFEKVA